VAIINKTPLPRAHTIEDDGNRARTQKDRETCTYIMGSKLYNKKLGLSVDIVLEQPADSTKEYYFVIRPQGAEFLLEAIEDYECAYVQVASAIPVLADDKIMVGETIINVVDVTTSRISLMLEGEYRE
jgi:hypothetical protein